MPSPYFKFINQKRVLKCDYLNKIIASARLGMAKIIIGIKHNTIIIRFCVAEFGDKFGGFLIGHT